MFNQRILKTEQRCADCEHVLIIKRNCQSIEIYCSGCKKIFHMRDLVNNLDKDMEEFLNNVHMDRF